MITRHSPEADIGVHQGRLFHALYHHRLIYNACWEDPRIDRQLLELKSDSKVVMITSAGCNALDYLLDDPAEIHAVDVNPRQNALLQLKIALFERANHHDLFAVFGRGGHPRFRALLNRLRPALSSFAAEYLAAKAEYFTGETARQSFYYHGSCGEIAWVMRFLLLRLRRQVREALMGLLHAHSLAEQQWAYEQIEPWLWNGFSRWLLRQRLVMAMLGVPRTQVRLIEAHHPGGIPGYLRGKLRHVATAIPMRDNYFWRVYLTGSYTRSCCPNYLKRSHFLPLQRRVGRIRTYDSTLSRFLETQADTYSHFVLLDHQDWLASHDTRALRHEWDWILRRSRPGTRVLFRSASPTAAFLPDNALGAIRFHEAKTMSMHAQDRVGTYGSLHLAEVA